MYWAMELAQGMAEGRAAVPWDHGDDESADRRWGAKCFKKPADRFGQNKLCEVSQLLWNYSSKIGFIINAEYLV